MSLSVGRLRLIGALLAACCCTSQAQKFVMYRTPIPRPMSLHIVYAFYIYSKEDAPYGTGAPYIKLSEMAGHSTSSRDPDELLENYLGLQVTLLRYTDFWRLINATHYCSDEKDVAKGKARRKHQLLHSQLLMDEGDNDKREIWSYTVNMGSPRPGMQLSINTTGIWILLISNCGRLSDGYINGDVTARHAYGYLPANEVYKMPFYGILGLVYWIMAVIWGGLCIRWRRVLFHIQYCILGVVLLGVLEGGWWLAFFLHFNQTATPLRWLFLVAVLFSVMKTVFSYMLVLVASLGWGVTKPHLERHTIRKVQVVAFVYIVLTFTREVVLAFRHSHTLPFTFVMLVLLPAAIVNGAIFYWVFNALGRLILNLREQKQTEKLELFRRLWLVLMASLTVAMCTVLFQIWDVSRGSTGRWQYQWFLSDGVTHILFCVVLAAMMYLWMPHEDSQRFAYSHQVDCDESPVPGLPRGAARGAAEDAAGDGGAGNSSPAATQIGAPGTGAPGAARDDLEGAGGDGAAADSMPAPAQNGAPTSDEV